MTKVQIEKKFGVHVVDDSYYSTMLGKTVKMYKIYSADGCPWENGLRTLKDVEHECVMWESALKAIAKIAVA